MEEVERKVEGSLLPRINDHVNNEDFDVNTDQLDFLTTKNSIMLSYLIELTYHTMNSENGDDPGSLKRLTEMKIVLDKMRPLEKKLKYQLDKLLAAGTTSSSFAAVGLPGGTSEDALSFRPNPKAMKKDDGESGDESESEGDDFSPLENESDIGSLDGDDDDDLAAAKATLQLARSRQQDKASLMAEGDKQTGVYRVPRMAAVPYPNGSEADQQEQKKRVARRRRQTELAQALRDQYGDTPEQEDMHGGTAFGQQREAARRLAQREKEKVEYEESTMVRLITSRRDKKERKRLMRQEASNLSAISDLGNLARGVSDAFDDDEGKHHRKRERDTSAVEGEVRMKKKNNKSIEAKNSFQKALFGKSDKKKRKKRR